MADDMDRLLALLPTTCDWGGCNEETIGMRYSIELEQILGVCLAHMGPAA